MHRIKGLSGRYAFVAPLLALIALFYFIPAIVTIPISLTDMDRSMEWHFVGFKHFWKMLNLDDPILPKVISNTAIFLILALALTIGLSLLIALITTNINEKLGIAFRVIWLLPKATPPVVWGFLWIWSFDPTQYGLLNLVLKYVGLQPRSWLSQHPLLIVILANALLGVPYVMTILSAALKAMPQTLVEAAKIDGASEWQVVRYIKIPLLKWPLTFLTVWYTLAFLTSFQYTLLITDGGPFYASETLPLYIYHRAFKFMDFGYGARLAVLLVIFSVLVAVIYWRVFGFKRMMEPSEVEL